MTQSSSYEFRESEVYEGHMLSYAFITYPHGLLMSQAGTKVL